ncbi:4Fe-4S dicluster domain-containing protein [Aporhodopirellula aestuarii]|uniref:Ferredoxin family protein n=1 Tax=Aporhodopirellula aestuarii TaxID=2950107 RepID=A0ABT0UCF5_9BACT|nr:ferredoxin family protein [Aporhodopirellula aestuarii]MCM2374466.1 ferredoxin family protein [Aporhodopirellula aestuarii]
MILAEKIRSCTLVVSKGQSRNPAKRALEQAIADAAGKIADLDVVIVPHLYDLPKNGESINRLRAIEGDVILASWIFPRAAHWVLDRNGVGGNVGKVLLGNDDSDEDDAESTLGEQQSADAADSTVRMTDLYPRPDRKIFCIDLKSSEDTTEFVAEIYRILGLDSEPADSRALPIVGGKIESVDEATGRRWYPVIDYSRCTNCMECVDFCLFGVYGVDGVESIMVEQPDNCRKGCPACSRVCPENAIIFPQHKAPAIAGAETEGDEGFKIDLSQLFGAPATGDDPIATAARERDEQLLLAGRGTVGIDERLKKRQASRQNQPKDELDRLVDSLDEMDL